MLVRFVALGVFLTAVCYVCAADKPTIEDVNADPSKFAGQTITFEKVKLYGSAHTGTARFRFTVKSPGDTIYKAQPGDDSKQKLIFATRNKKDEAKEFTKSLSPEYYYLVNITVKIEPTKGKAKEEQGRHWAHVESIEHLPALKGYKSK